MPNYKTINPLIHYTKTFQNHIIHNSYYFQNNKSSLYTLLSLPLFASSIYLNAKRKILMAITILFLSSSFLLAIYSLRTGEDAYTHMLFVLNIMGLSLLYRKEKAKLYFNISLYFTIACILFVLISYKMHWFLDFIDSRIEFYDFQDFRYSCI